VLTTFASNVLASGNLALGRVGPFDMSVNGQQVVDEVEFFRALRKAFYGRGLRSVEFGFSVQRFFASLARAEAFFFTGYNDLPDEGDLVLGCGEGDADAQNVGIVGAVLDSCDATRLQGTVVVVRYRFRGGRFTTDVSPGPEPDEDVIRRGTVNIADAATSKAVVFSSVMSGVPVVACNLVMPTTGGDAIFATIIEDTVTTAGFTVAFSGPVPSGSYKLNYIAIS
jgi:hypothetical protein